MEAIARARRAGKSIVITLPEETVRQESIEEGELVRIEVKKVVESGFGMFKGMKKFTREDEFDIHE